jgi:hypothetical protein
MTDNPRQRKALGGGKKGNMGKSKRKGMGSSMAMTTTTPTSFSRLTDNEKMLPQSADFSPSSFEIEDDEEGRITIVSRSLDRERSNQRRNR